MSSIYGPFATRAGVMQRSPHLIDLIIRNSPLATAYRLWGARTLDNAYGTMVGSGLTGTGGLQIMEARAKTLAASPTIVRKGWIVPEVRKDQTSFLLDMDDYIVSNGGSPPEIPSDEETLYVRVQEYRPSMGWLAVDGGAGNNAGNPYLGPILVVYPPSFYGRSVTAISVAGTAPAGSDCSSGTPPVFDATMQKPLPLHIVWSTPLGSLTIKNISADLGPTLLVSFGLGQPMLPIAPGGECTPTGGGYSFPAVNEVILAMSGGGGGCAFTIDGVIARQI